MAKPLSLTIVIPVFNEEENLPELIDRLEKLVPQMGRPCNVLFIEDGSQDGTYALLAKARERLPWIGILKFARNFGQQIGLGAGFRHANGEIVAMIDADLQLDPEDIPVMADKLDEGYDAAVGFRRNRPENVFLRQIPSRLANWSLSKLGGVKFDDLGCGLQVFRRSLFQDLDPSRTVFTHSDVFAVWRGGNVAQVPVNFHPRKHGESKYSTIDLGYLLLDLLITFSNSPALLFVSFAIGMAALGLAGLGLAGSLMAWTFGGEFPLALAMFSCFLGLSGLFAVAVGFINERIARMSRVLDGAPRYIIDRLDEPAVFAGAVSHE